MKNEEVKKQNSINFLIVFNFLIIHTSAEAEKLSHDPFSLLALSSSPPYTCRIIIFVT